MTEATELFNALTRAIHSAQPEERQSRIDAVTRLGEYLSAPRRADTMGWHAGVGFLLARCEIGAHQVAGVANIFPYVTHDSKGSVTSIRFNELTCLKIDPDLPETYEVCCNSLLLLPNGGVSLSEVTRNMRTDDMLREVRQAPDGFKRPMAKAFLPAFSSSRYAREQLRTTAGLAKL